MKKFRILQTPRKIFCKSSSSDTIPQTEFRENELKIQMLSNDLHKQIFGSINQKSSPELQETAIEHLKRQNLWDKPTAQRLNDISVKLPTLEGKNIRDHFERIASLEYEQYKKKANYFANSILPKMPTSWSVQEGWVRYSECGEAVAVERPECDALVFDVEVLQEEQNCQYPTLAVAASAKYWYCWISPQLLNAIKPYALIPLGDNAERLIIGHHVSYDRAKILDEYHLDLSHNRFIDTMSLHIAVNGICSKQEDTLRCYKSLEDVKQKDMLLQNPWLESASGKSLASVAESYGIHVDKTRRDVFVEGNRETLLANMQVYINYCARDVLVTHQIYQKLFPAFLKTCSSVVSFGGMLDMGSSFLPVTATWKEYIENAERTYQEAIVDIDRKLVSMAKNIAALKDSPNEYVNDPWLKNLDWTMAPMRMTKAKLDKYGNVKPGGEPRPYKNQMLPNMPNWYKSLYIPKLKEIRVTAKTRITPSLFKLRWLGYPLVYLDNHGWTFCVPRNHDDARLSRYYPCFEDDVHNYYRLPHKDGDQNVGSPLTKHFLKSFEDGTLYSEFPEAIEALKISASCSYWVSARERVKNQFVLWQKKGELGFPADKDYGMILPQTVVMGTITRRAVEPTWMTASNAKANRIGSELKSKIQAPNGYRIVGADVDSQELWIASLIGDARFGIHGATAFGYMNLMGSKSAGTDMHSVSANILGISRDNAKVFNYGRIYGAGKSFASSLLQQFNPNISPEDAKKKADELYSATKGIRKYKKSAANLWIGGSESVMFNRLEDIARSSDPRTPVLNCGISNVVLNSGEDLLPSKVNWVVQSSGVDYLHLLLVSMQYLIRKYNIHARFMISIHDEIRYLSTEEDAERTAMALQISNIWTRALFCYQLGMLDLPLSVAFFSSVDIDTVLRKEVFFDCVTPSNPSAVPVGESKTIYDLVKNPSCHLHDASFRKIENRNLKGQTYDSDYVNDLRAQCGMDPLEATRIKIN